MKLEEIEKIAAGSAKRPWKWHRMQDGMNCRLLQDHKGCMFGYIDDDQNGEFIAMAANHIDKLIAIAKLSKEAIPEMICTCSIGDCARCDLVMALADLEAETGADKKCTCPLLMDDGKIFSGANYLCPIHGG